MGIAGLEIQEEVISLGMFTKDRIIRWFYDDKGVQCDRDQGGEDR